MHNPNSQVTFSGEGDQEPGLEPGDIIIVLDEKAHPLYKRNGQDLIMKMDISLTEALTGLKKAIQTLDERTLVIQTVKGPVAPAPCTLHPAPCTLHPARRIS